MCACTQVCCNDCSCSCDCGFELVDHPTHSTDFAPSEYVLFPNMKKETFGFEAKDFFEVQNETFYTTGIQALQQRWKKITYGQI